MASGNGSELEITSDLSFQRRMWMAERIGWTIMALVLAAALLGLFGEGPLSLSSKTSEDGMLVVDYQRFGRRGADSVVVVRIDPTAVDHGKIDLVVSSNYLHDMKIDQVTPMPDSAEAGRGGTTFTFLARREAASEVSFDLTPDAMGAVSGEVRLPGKSPVAFTQFFYP